MFAHSKQVRVVSFNSIMPLQINMLQLHSDKSSGSGVYVCVAGVGLMKMDQGRQGSMNKKKLYSAFAAL